MPERLDASYVGEDGAAPRPVMLHRAIFGSMERFIGILIEHYAGSFPLWLAPVQVVVATITGAADDYAAGGRARLRRRGTARGLDFDNEKINYKVREHSLAKIPIMLVVGKREAETGRSRCVGSAARSKKFLHSTTPSLDWQQNPQFRSGEGHCVPEGCFDGATGPGVRFLGGRK